MIPLWGIHRDYPPRGEPLGLEVWGRGLGGERDGNEAREMGAGPQGWGTE